LNDTRKALDVLARAGISLTLVDVGASLEPFPPFRPLLGHATYVGFDPDRREMHTETSASARRVIIDKALVAESDRATARFFLTRNPTCSSTLRPSDDALEPYLHAYRFDVVDESEVPATTLTAALASASLDRVDWIKLDTQGTDLRLLGGLDESLFSRLMAVDAEPGFDQYYEGEDVFGDLHRELVGRGFWMSDLTCERAVRLRRGTFERILRGETSGRRTAYEFTLKTSPIAAAPRYLRTLASLDKSGATRDDYLRLWACAYVSGNHPYALDVIVECRDRHGPEAGVDRLVDLAVRRNRHHAWRGSWRLVEKVNVRNLKRFVSKSY
jgi:FkbM family methyltransferase